MTKAYGVERSAFTIRVWSLRSGEASAWPISLNSQRRSRKKMAGAAPPVMVRIWGFFCGPRVQEEKGRLMARPGWMTKRELTEKKRTTRKRTLMIGIKPKRAGWN